MCIYSSTKEKKNMKSVWWLKLSLLWVPTSRDTQAGQACYPWVQVGERSQGHVQGSECLVQEAGEWWSSSRARAGPHVLWVEEMLTLTLALLRGRCGVKSAGLAWGACWQEARWLRTACVCLCKWLKLSALWHFLTSGVFLPGHGPKLTRKAWTSDGGDTLRLFIVWLQCM